MLFWTAAHGGAIPREGMVKADEEGENGKSCSICKIRIKTLQIR
jgi:hypothetical protein